MKTRILVAFLVVGVALPWTVAAKEKKQAGPAPLIGWLNVQSASRKFSISEQDFQKVTLDSAPGALLAVLTNERKTWRYVSPRWGAPNFKMGRMELGWVEITPAELNPPGILSTE